MPTPILVDYIIAETALIHSTEVAVASAALIVYDHVITFDQEVDLFWTGRRDASRFFYLSVKYVPLHTVIALRVWYLFTRNRQIRVFAASLYILCIGSTMVLSGTLFDQFFQEMVHPSLTKSPTIFALVYAPGFVNHSVLFSLKVYRFMTSDRFQRRSSLLKGFLKDLGSLLYTITALSLTNVAQLDIYYTGLQGGLVVGATIVSVCHALLSIRSISATLHVDPAWLLNHAELSRVQWTKGDSEGEIFVELHDAVSSSGSDFDGLGTPTKS
ncbi:hypothetical protein CY34DRAFT_785900 [Suillus luteus UH-Slu-Lm8-n1]|uniref:DUF6533 domain-containing protein n=1 Tax=Suillus luteus UH-Slu-Lm8-n1 TaxID=930992 RepID=A0A0D0A2Z5_9AGAM|nr:hypothetical protein CY34DRAFT_785900 [Suillus luteus UH-Slu-Lm8-n1]